MSVIQYILDLGASVMIPIMILLIGIILGQRPGKAFRSGLTVGIGFVGINLVIGLLTNNLGPAAQAMVKHLGLHLSIIDVGWPATAAIAFGSTVGSLAIPIGLIVNIAMLLLGLTKTLDIDLWNYWHIAFTGALVAVMTGNFLLAVLTSAVHMIVLLSLADRTARWVETYYQYPNISFPHGTSAPYYLIGAPLNALFDRIPFINRIQWNPQFLQSKLGVFGESTVLGLIIGLIIGVLAGYSLKQTLQLAVNLAAVLLLLPRTVSILMEGLLPVSEAAGKFIRDRFPGRSVYIGMDSAIAVGDPANIASSLLLVPVTLLLAMAIPGNRVLPFGDLATIPFIVALLVPIFRGNVFRTVLGGAVAIAIGLPIATWVSPLMTKAARQVGFQFPADTTAISSLVDGANPLTLVILLIAKAGWVGMAVFGLIALSAAWWFGRSEGKGVARDHA
ncbi:MAG: PTS transporter subunit IIC [Kyrpidia sp.]|nr:PTS transporter subunit IIC [Kyrpidia sp.]